MSYTDYSSHWQLDAFLTYLEANILGSNDQHLYDTLAVEHNINTTTVDGTHKANSITGSMINTTPVSTGSQTVLSGATWTPAVGVYQIVTTSTYGFLTLGIFVSGSWRIGDLTTAGGSIWAMVGTYFFDGTNMRVDNTQSGTGATLYYQKF